MPSVFSVTLNDEQVSKLRQVLETYKLESFEQAYHKAIDSLLNRTFTLSGDKIFTDPAPSSSTTKENNDGDSVLHD